MEFNLDRYIENHPERIIEGVVKRNEYDEWTVYSEKFKRYYHFGYNNEFEIKTEYGWSNFVFLNNDMQSAEGRYKDNEGEYTFKDNEEVYVRIIKKLNLELREFLEECGLKPDVVVHFLKKLEEQGFSVFDCVYVGTNHLKENSIIDIKGTNFLVFENFQEEKRCSVQHDYIYDDQFDKAASSIDTFTFTLNDGKTFTYIYEHEVEQFKNFPEDTLNFPLKEFHYDISQEGWQYQPISELVETESESFIYSFGEVPSKGTVNTGIDFIYLKSTRGMIGVSDQHAINALISAKDKVESNKFEYQDGQQLAIRGIVFDRIEDKTKLFVDYLTETHPTCTELEIERAFLNSDITLVPKNLEVIVKIYKGINMDPFDDSYITEEYFYKDVKKQMNW